MDVNHEIIGSDVTNDIIGSDIISLVLLYSLVSMLSPDFMLGLDGKMGPQIQEVGIIFASMVLCDKVSLTEDMGLLFGRVVN